MAKKRKFNKKDDLKDLNERIEIEEIAERIKLLFGFVAMLIPHKEKLKAIAERTSNNHSRAQALAPVLTAFGEDWEKAEMETALYYKRAEALYNLVDVLDETEKERIEYSEKKKQGGAGRDNLMRSIGLS